MAAHGARRLLPMVQNAVAVIAIELLAAAQGCDFHAPLTSSPPLERVRAVLRRQVAHLEDDRHFYPDLQKAIALVRDGTIATAAGSLLPTACDESQYRGASYRYFCTAPSFRPRILVADVFVTSAISYRSLHPVPRGLSCGKSKDRQDPGLAIRQAARALSQRPAETARYSEGSNR